MEFNRLTKHGAAIHEAGHASLACATGIRFKYVRVFLDDKTDWGGKCLLVEDPALTNVKLAAFQIGGPLAQLLIIPESLGNEFHKFETSLFEYAENFFVEDWDLLKRICWASDLVSPSYMMSAAKLAKYLREAPPDLASTLVPHPWLHNLEKRVRCFLETPECVRFIAAIARELEQLGEMEAHPVQELFAAMVPRTCCEPLVRFCLHPETN